MSGRLGRVQDGRNLLGTDLAITSDLWRSLVVLQPVVVALVWCAASSSFRAPVTCVMGLGLR